MMSTRKSLLHLIAGLALAAFSATMERASFACRTFGDACLRVRDYCVSFVKVTISRFAVEPAAWLALPAIALVAARAYLARYVKRDRPDMQSRYRLCPSV